MPNPPAPLKLRLSPHVPEDVHRLAHEDVQVSGREVGRPVRIRHGDVQHRLEVLSSQVLCQEGKPLGAGGDVVLEQREALGPGVVHAFLVLLLGEPGALTIDGHLGVEQKGAGGRKSGGWDRRGRGGA